MRDRGRVATERVAERETKSRRHAHDARLHSARGAGTETPHGGT